MKLLNFHSGVGPGFRKSARFGFGLAGLTLRWGTPVTICAQADPAPAATAAEQMQARGPEATELSARAGKWAVEATSRPSADAPEMVTRGLVAQREMIGLYLQEIMEPTAESGVPAFTRIAYLTYSRIEGRWPYASMDTRFPVGIMPAYRFGRQGKDRTLTLVFEPIAFVGVAKAIEGRMVRSNLVIDRKSADHEIIRQYFISSDGTEREWLATQYEYTRIR